MAQHTKDRIFLGLENGANPTSSSLITNARLSTFNTWPQYIFPSLWNNLPSYLEVPYAFSHHTGSFFWTREDALNDIHWNIWANTPCLNCIIKGESRARSCDRMRKQEVSYGQTTCCTACQRDGMGDACIETIEQRITPLGAPSNQSCNRDNGFRGKLFVDERVWSDSEIALRKEGWVIWKPINFQVGNVDAKAAVVKRFRQGEGNDLSHFVFTENPQRFFRTIGGTGLQYDIRDNMRRIVAEWDSATEEQSKSVSGLERTISTPDTDYEQQAISLDDVCKHWTSTLAQSQTNLYQTELTTQGYLQAYETAERWKQDREEVIPQVQQFLSLKMKAIVEDGMEMDEANETAAEELTAKARYWFERLIPEMITK